jgi:DNA repair exonuclease SbcCD ATPase subunit
VSAEAQTYERFAIVRIRPRPESEYDIKDKVPLAGTIAVVKSPVVLTKALAMPGIGELPWIARLKPANKEVEWLAQQLDVRGATGTDDAGDLLLVGMKGDDPRQLALLVNAVAKAFVAWVADQERQSLGSRMELLSRHLQAKTADVDRKRELVQRLVENLGTDDLKAIQKKQEQQLDDILKLRKEIMAKKSVILLKEQQANQAKDPKLAAEVTALRTENDKLAAQFEKMSNEMEDLGSCGEELDRRKEDLATAQETLDKLRIAMKQIESQLQSPPYVTLVQEAPVSNPNN